MLNDDALELILIHRYSLIDNNQDLLGESIEIQDEVIIYFYNIVYYNWLFQIFGFRQHIIGDCLTLLKINEKFIHLLRKNPCLIISNFYITKLHALFKSLQLWYFGMAPDVSEISQEEYETLQEIADKGIKANVFLYYGLVFMINKRLFLNEYEAVLINVNGQQRVTEFDTDAKIEIVDQWHHVKATIKFSNLIFIIRFNNNEVSVFQTEQLKDQLKEQGFIGLTVRLKKKFKSMLELSFWRFVMLKVLKGYLDSRINIRSSST